MELLYCPLLLFYFFEVLVYVASRIFYILYMTDDFSFCHLSLFLCFQHFLLVQLYLEIKKIYVQFFKDKTLQRFIVETCICTHSVWFSHFQCCKSGFVFLSDVSLITPLKYSHQFFSQKVLALLTNLIISLALTSGNTLISSLFPPCPYQLEFFC